MWFIRHLSCVRVCVCSEKKPPEVLPYLKRGEIFVRLAVVVSNLAASNDPGGHAGRRGARSARSLCKAARIALRSRSDAEPGGVGRGESTLTLAKPEDRGARPEPNPYSSLITDDAVRTRWNAFPRGSHAVYSVPTLPLVLVPFRLACSRQTLPSGLFSVLRAGTLPLVPRSDSTPLKASLAA